jgi:hypothetical protein
VKNGLPEEVSTIELRYLATNPTEEIVNPPKKTITTIFETQP